MNIEQIMKHDQRALTEQRDQRDAMMRQTRFTELRREASKDEQAFAPVSETCRRLGLRAPKNAEELRELLSWIDPTSGVGAFMLNALAPLSDTLTEQRTPPQEERAQVARSVAWPGEIVTLRELAERLGMERSSCRRYVLSLGVKPIRQRTAASGYQVALTFTRAQADEVFARRRAEGYC